MDFQLQIAVNLFSRNKLRWGTALGANITQSGQRKRKLQLHHNVSLSDSADLLRAGERARDRLLLEPLQGTIRRSRVQSSDFVWLWNEDKTQSLYILLRCDSPFVSSQVSLNIIFKHYNHVTINFDIAFIAQAFISSPPIHVIRHMDLKEKKQAESDCLHQRLAYTLIQGFTLSSLYLLFP